MMEERTRADSGLKPLFGRLFAAVYQHFPVNSLYYRHAIALKTPFIGLKGLRQKPDFFSY
jgi:hypothetical protein